MQAVSLDHITLTVALIRLRPVYANSIMVTLNARKRILDVGSDVNGMLLVAVPSRASPVINVNVQTEVTTRSETSQPFADVVVLGSKSFEAKTANN